MTIRAATLDDIEVLASLEVSCFDEAWSRDGIEKALRDPKYVVLVIEREGKIGGYALGWSVGEEADLARVAVLPSWRGQGIGEKLTRALMEEFYKRGVREIFLEVRESNTAAQRLYARCGFEEVGRRPEYYAGGESAVLMRRQFTTIE